MHKFGSFIVNIITNQGVIYLLYLAVFISIVYVGASTLPKYELIEKNIDKNEQSAETENSSYRKLEGDVEGFQLIITDGEDFQKVIDPLCIYEKIEEPEKLYVEISRNDIP